MKGSYLRPLQSSLDGYKPGYKCQFMASQLPCIQCLSPRNGSDARTSFGSNVPSRSLGIWMGSSLNSRGRCVRCGCCPQRSSVIRRWAASIDAQLAEQVLQAIVEVFVCPVRYVGKRIVEPTLCRPLIGEVNQVCGGPLPTRFCRWRTAALGQGWSPL